MRPDDRSRPWRWLVVLVAAVLLASVVGYVAGSRVRSPQEALADAEPPADTLLTSRVSEGRISGRESFVATVRWRSIRTVRVTGAGGYLTDAPLRPGERIEPGAVLATVSDHPLVVLDGVVPMLRDLHPGDSGADVARLQDGLRAAGTYAGASDGVLGAGTLAALDTLYEAGGYDLPEREVASEGRPGRSRVEQYVAASEIAFVPRLPVVLLRYVVPVGGAVADAIAEVGVDGLAVQADVPGTWQPALARPGGSGARIAVRVGGRSYDAVVSDLGRSRVEEERGEVVAVTVEAQGLALPASRAGTKAELVLAERRPARGLRVPLSALYTTADVGDVVRVARGEEAVRVPVRIVATGDGVAIVRPRADGALRAGDEAVIGVDRPGG